MRSMKPTGGAAMINKAQASEPKSGHAAPAAAKGGSEVGNETRADMAGTGLSGAVAELHSQHPIPYHDHGPHHGHSHHIRHEPMHGMKSRG